MTFGLYVEEEPNLTIFGLDVYVGLSVQLRLLLKVGQTIVWA